MGKYHFNEIEEKWQKYWAKNQTFKAKNPGSPSSEGLGEAYDVINKFPYPFGAYLHVEHRLGYISSDIYARYKSNQRYNVLLTIVDQSLVLSPKLYTLHT